MKTEKECLEEIIRCKEGLKRLDNLKTQVESLQQEFDMGRYVRGWCDCEMVIQKKLEANQVSLCVARGE